MQVVIDYRETKLFELLKDIIKSDEIELVKENLLLGDIIIRIDNVEKIIIERKSVNDLISSIKDGRYNEQSLRLSSLEQDNHNIIYLIEGDVKVQKQMVYSAIFSINYYKGFSIYRSNNLEDTAYIISNITLKLLKEKSRMPYYNNKNEENNKDVSYSSVIKKKKSDNITKDNFGEIVLMQIPGISNITASYIMKEFKTIMNLMEKLKENPNILDNFTYINEKQQSRKINKNCIKNIIEFLTNI